jgi:hypothetical protein
MAFIVVHGTNKWQEIRWCLGVSPGPPTGGFARRGLRPRGRGQHLEYRLGIAVEGGGLGARIAVNRLSGCTVLSRTDRYWGSSRVWWLRAPCSAEVAASQIRTVWSEDPERMRVPSRE